MPPVLFSVKSSNNLPALIDRLKREVAGSHVKVGVLGTGEARKPDEGEQPDATNVEVAIFNEFGTSEIPERPFLRSTFAANEVAYRELIGKLLSAIVTRGFDVRAGLDRIGFKVSADVKKTITQGDEVPPPNAPSTLKRKLEKTRKGAKGSPRTLVDTGQLANSIAHATKIGGTE